MTGNPFKSCSKLYETSEFLKYFYAHSRFDSRNFQITVRRIMYFISFLVPEGDECLPNPCGPYSGCRVVQGSAVCFCLSEYEGDPPITPCHLPNNPCSPSPCGPNTQCTLLDNGFAKCTCLPGYIESPNTIRGCVEKKNPCEPNPCGQSAVCDPNRQPSCFCPEPLIGNPYKFCGGTY